MRPAPRTNSAFVLPFSVSSVLLLLLLCLLAGRAQGAATNLWQGAAGGAWSTATNWSLGHVPTAEIATFDTAEGSSNTNCNLDSSQTCAGVYIASNYTSTISGSTTQAATLTVNGGYSQYGGVFMTAQGGWTFALSPHFFGV